SDHHKYSYNIYAYYFRQGLDWSPVPLAPARREWQGLGMAYEVDPERSAAQSVEKTLRRTLKRASSALRAPERDAERIHDARTGVKKARALLRLVKPRISRSEFRTRDRELRDAGRELSAVRDAHILVNALAVLIERAWSDDRALLEPLRCEI